MHHGARVNPRHPQPREHARILSRLSRAHASTREPKKRYGQAERNEPKAAATSACRRQHAQTQASCPGPLATARRLRLHRPGNPGDHAACRRPARSAPSCPMRTRTTRGATAVLKHIGWLAHSDQVDAFDDRALRAGRAVGTSGSGRELERAPRSSSRLISPDFVGSRYCCGGRAVAGDRASEGQRDGSADLVPIVCDHVDLGALPLAAHQCLPQDEQNDLKPLRRLAQPQPAAGPDARPRSARWSRRAGRRLPSEPRPAAPPPTPPVAATPSLGARLALWGAAKLAGLVGPMLGGHVGTLATTRLPLPAPKSPAPPRRYRWRKICRPAADLSAGLPISTSCALGFRRWRSTRRSARPRRHR